MCWHPAKRMGGKAHEPGWHREEFSSLAEREIFLPGTFCFCKGEGKMKFSPPVEEVKALTARGEYKVISFDNRPRLSLFLPQHMQG